MKIRPVLAALVPALLVLSACGGEDGSGGAASSQEGKEYVEALSKSITEDPESSKYIDAKQAECWSEKVVDIIGVDQLKKSGTPKELATGGGSGSFDLSSFEVSTEQAGKIYDGFGDCGIDLHGLMVKSFTEGEEQLPADAQKCLEDALTEDTLRDFMVAVMAKGSDTQDDPAVAALSTALMSCATAGLDGDAGTPTPGS